MKEPIWRPTIMKMLILVFSLAVGFTSQAVAQDKAPATKKFTISVKKLPKPMQSHILKVLKEKGIKNVASAQASASTKNCPSNCNSSSGGGYCFCKPDSGGKCPSGTEKGGSPGDEYCKVQMPKLSIGVNGVPDPVEVQMP